MKDAFPAITTSEESDNSSLDTDRGHKTQLDSLKDSDPKFYKYLQEEEAELLAFEDSDASDDAKTEDAFQGVDTNNKSLTVDVIRNWGEIISKEKSLKMLKKAVVTLHTAALFDEKSVSEAHPFIINSDVFNALATLIFKQVPNILRDHLSTKTLAHEKNEKKTKKLLFILKVQFSNILRLLHNLTDPNMLHMILEETEKLIPHALTHRKFMKHLIKLLVQLWSIQSSDKVKNSAYVIIKKILLIGDKSYIEYSLSTIYSAFNQQSPHTNAITLPIIRFMKNTASELFGINQAVSYQVSFKYIRQLAIHLRNAIIKHDQESYKAVYSWKYVHSIDFWSCVLSNHCDKTKKSIHPFPMQDLIYPLVQITLGTIKHVSSSQFFPLKFHLIRSLINVSYYTGVYIPLASYIFEILESKEIKNKPAPSTAKPIDFELCIRAPKSYLKGKIYQDGLIEQVIELLLEIYSLQCKSISFPELSMPMIIQIKRYIKKSKNSKLNKLLVIFIEKLKENSEFIESRRKSIEFSPNKIGQMEAFLEDYSWDMTPLGKYVNSQRKIKKERKKIENETQEQNIDKILSEESENWTDMDDYEDSLN
ncbi:unnamed protein product [Pneumocystis jirovecii]|uniref:Nucleolar complex protein 2 n=1 Tax=Pneumocystis jirovecii TaxID=42068 RepID=L0PCX5_PNEJI|nr:unnamed protein product [Pneumocystis jirovecii]